MGGWVLVAYICGNIFLEIKNIFLNLKNNFLFLRKKFLRCYRWSDGAGGCTFATFDGLPQIWPKPPKTPVLGGVKFGQISTPWRGVKFGSKVPKVAARAPLAILFLVDQKVNQSLIRGGYPNTPPFGGGIWYPPHFWPNLGFSQKNPNLLKFAKLKFNFANYNKYLFIFFKLKKINKYILFFLN